MQTIQRSNVFFFWRTYWQCKNDKISIKKNSNGTHSPTYEIRLDLVYIKQIKYIWTSHWRAARWSVEGARGVQHKPACSQPHTPNPLMKQTFYSLWISPRKLLSLLLWLSFIYSLCLLVWRHSLNSRSNKQTNKQTHKQLFLYVSSFSWFMNNPSVVILTAVVVVIHFTVFVCLSGATPVAHSLSR